MLIGCATAPSDAEVSAKATQMLKASFKERGQAKLDRLDQDETQKTARLIMDYVRQGGRLGFITPLTHNFCESCNRVRITCTGTLFMCLGQEDAVNLIVNGFCKEVLQQLPMEFAVEAQKLVGISLEGSVG